MVYGRRLILITTVPKASLEISAQGETIVICFPQT
jgi:hypothetical protein